MKRKIIIEKCSECPFVQLDFCELEGEDKATDHYFCAGDGYTADIDELVEGNTIPDWCPLEKEGEKKC